MYAKKHLLMPLCVLLSASALFFSGCRISRVPEDTGAAETGAPVTKEPLKPELILPESVSFHNVITGVGSSLSIDRFVTGVPEGLEVEFLATPDSMTPGLSTVYLLFRSGELTLTRPVDLRIFEIVTDVKKDVRDPAASVSVRDFIPDENVPASFVNFDPASVEKGVIKTYPVRVLVEGTEYACSVTFTEMTPPTAKMKDAVTMLGILPSPESLVEEFVSVGEIVSCKYTETPDVSKEGKQTVTLELIDSYGNTGRVSGTLNVVTDNEPPVITVSKKTIYSGVGDSISYRDGVTVTDNSGEEIELVVDSSGVDRFKKGTYKVIYSATDSAGNTASVTVTVEIDELTEALMNSMCDYVIKRIITDDMSLDEKIYAIWKFSKQSIKYVGSSNKSDLFHGAYEGFQTNMGDCYTFYAVNTLLFNRLGIKNVEVRRCNGLTNHWWSLVQFEDGMWYHVDSCLGPNAIVKYETFKMTEETLVKYTKLVAAGRRYYEYDHSLPQYVGLDIATDEKVEARKKAPVETAAPVDPHGDEKENVPEE